MTDTIAGSLQLQETLDSTRLDLHAQLQQLSSRSRALCQALGSAVDLLLHCIRTISQAANNLSTSGTPGLSGDAEQLLLTPANAEAIAALVDLTVSEVCSPVHTYLMGRCPRSGKLER